RRVRSWLERAHEIPRRSRFLFGGSFHPDQQKYLGQIERQAEGDPAEGGRRRRGGCSGGIRKTQCRGYRAPGKSRHRDDHLRRSNRQALLRPGLRGGLGRYHPSERGKRPQAENLFFENSVKRKSCPL